MSDNDKEEMEKAREPVNFDGFEEQISSLHDNLDGIKEAGREISQAIEGELPDGATQEEVMEAQRLMAKANLLTRRVESGDKNVVRGE